MTETTIKPHEIPGVISHSGTFLSGWAITRFADQSQVIFRGAISNELKEGLPK